MRKYKFKYNIFVLFTKIVPRNFNNLVYKIIRIIKKSEIKSLFYVRQRIIYLFIIIEYRYDSFP